VNRGVRDKRTDEPGQGGGLSVTMQLFLLAGGLVGAVLFLQWLVGSLRPQTVPQSAGPVVSQKAMPTYTPAAAPATVAPEPGGEYGWLTPIQEAANISTGPWSPGSRYLVMVQVEASTDPKRERVYSSFKFFDAQSGEICTSWEPQLGMLEVNGSSSWLPDGRLLFASGQDIYLLTPCDPQAEELSELFSEPVQLSWPASRSSGRYLLLAGEANFWVYDSQEQTAYPLEEPKPSRGTRDNIFWSPADQQTVLISQVVEDADLSSARLSLVDVPGAKIIETIEVPYLSGGSAPFVDWMLEDSLLVYGGPNKSSLLVERQAGGSPKIRPVLTDIYRLNLQPGEQIIAEGTLGDPHKGSYHLFLAYTSPQGDAILLYHAEDGRMERLPFEYNTLLRFPSGELVTLNRLEYEPTYSNEFELVFVDNTEQPSLHLQVAGHNPRTYPQLFVAWDQARQRLALASNQGVSLVSAMDGSLIDFWKLAGAEQSEYVSLLQSPDGQVLLAQALVPESFMGPPPSLLYVLPVRNDKE